MEAPTSIIKSIHHVENTFHVFLFKHDIGYGPEDNNNLYCDCNHPQMPN